MAKYIGTILTKKGKDLLVRAALGEVMTFTKVEIGKGIISQGSNKEDLVSLIESFKTLSITSTTILEAGNYRVRVAFNNSGVLEDTYLREIGVFARGEDGIEVLYSYCDTATPDLIPRESSGILERVEDIITYISSAATVNAVIDQSNVYATIKDLTEGLALKEPKFNKNSGFNLVISHVINSTSKILVASAYAVKLAFDKGKEALGLTVINKNQIQNNQEQIESLSLKVYDMAIPKSGFTSTVTRQTQTFDIPVEAGIVPLLCVPYVPHSSSSTGLVCLENVEILNFTATSIDVSYDYGGTSNIGIEARVKIIGYKI
ncbi:MULTISPECIES: hypothetical protein [Psychrilyobacter]|uniref:Uncharacterized protein n=1 Tax=Psychrilyobacter piezotolerans TaxID=2293438 RepID=A0ABX9KJQ8_9FUSO|nr:MULTISPECIES: hypothetical protein [Psychrilyobacter]MCS5421239.1 hypothetical protein [Psychrilyobacter sp. S5]NDI77004.1 hypothetical protein [Psychrilyobacter piezotolerans]RDE64621.1 hypothetical protein DV867_03510 [Psychrilyobacter sp. S5]REI42433.1 hypothetical protein DYH56_03510 [Psychrilyobacter piezotolerans]